MVFRPGRTFDIGHLKDVNLKLDYVCVDLKLDHVCSEPCSDRQGENGSVFIAVSSHLLCPQGFD